ncbi:MAG: hypothetical protein IT370_35515 [Deltaproteobacteria bacterium]|nr:hypothetical protein [Deltaproteobacteria bacterium]
MQDKQGLSRRQALATMAGAGAGVALAAAPGCASLPRAGKDPAIHLCDHRFCRYYRADRGGGTWGRCGLPLRDLGGSP